MNMILEHKLVDIKYDWCDQYNIDFDRLIQFGSVGYNPNTNQIVTSFAPNGSVGLYTILTDVFAQFQVSHSRIYPIYPLLNRGFTNDINIKVYHIIRDIYHQCKNLATEEYNTVLFNLAKGNVFKHRHNFAAPDELPVNTQVFVIRLTNFNQPNLEFRIYDTQQFDTYESQSLNENCMMRFNGLMTHEVITSDDNNYYGYFVFEKWHD